MSGTGAEKSALPAERASWRAGLAAPAVLLLTLIAYWPAFSGEYVWDDKKQVVENEAVHAKDGLQRIWTNRKSLDYFPLTYSAHWLEWRLFNGSPAGPHVINVVLHGLSAVLLGLILQRLRVPGAWLAAFFFALHPVAVASAAWISERKNTLSMVFYLGSILAWLRSEDMRVARASIGSPISAFGNRKSAIGNYLLSLGLFLLALLAKTSVVMLPVVLLLLTAWRRGKPARKDLLRTVPFFALSLALGLVTVWYQWHNVIGQSHEAVRPGGVASRIAASGWIVWFYLSKSLLPLGLNAIYTRWNVDGSSVLSFLPLALLAAFTALLWAQRKRWGMGPLVAWGCFVVSLLPVLGFVDMAFMWLSLVADHLQYVAMPAILALAAAILARAAAGGARRAAPVAGVICVAALAALTFQRAKVFTTEERLRTDIVEKTPRSFRAWDDLGMVYVEAKKLDDAFRCFNKALELNPKYAPTWLALGNAQVAAKRTDEAIRDYDQAIAIDPDYADVWFNRGTLRARAGDSEDALRDLGKAIALNPAYAEAYCSRGNICASAGRFAEAIRDYDQALRINPDYAEAWFNQASAYANAGQPEKALLDLDQAIALKPGDAEAYANRGNIRASAKRYDEAIGDYDRAIACDPGYADAWYHRAYAYAATDRPAEAVRDLSRVIELRPQDAGAWYNRGMMYSRMKQDRDALADFLMVRKLGGTVPEELLRSLGRSAQPPG